AWPARPPVRVTGTDGEIRQVEPEVPSARWAVRPCNGRLRGSGAGRAFSCLPTARAAVRASPRAGVAAAGTRDCVTPPVVASVDAMTQHHHHHHAGHGHHHHEHASAASIRHERPLWWALALIVLFAGVEAAAAFATNSLALLSDAVHMVTDAFALGVALVAVRLGRRPPDARRSFGYVRAEAMGALLNGLLLFVLSGYILWEAAHRFLAPPAVASLGMLVVGVAGLLVNLVAMRLLHAGSE